MDEMITRAEAERLMAEAVAKAVAEVMAKAEVAKIAAVEAAVTPLKGALEQARHMIRALRQVIYGVKSESCDYHFEAENQQHLDCVKGGNPSVEIAKDDKDKDAASQGSGDATPDATVAGKTAAKASSRPKREHLGVAQRHPKLPIEVRDAPIPAEIQEQVAAGTAKVEKTGRFTDEVVIPGEKPFIRRTYELKVVPVEGGPMQMTLPMPVRVVDGGTLADETIHKLMIGRFQDAIPFHRTLAQWQRLGVDIPRQTVSDAFFRWAHLFAPLATLLTERVLASPVVHADDSWARVQDKTVCRTGHIWVMVGTDCVAYRFTKDITHDRARELIPNTFRGYLVVDAWPGWGKLEDIHRSGCNAHARRPFARWLDDHRHDGTPDGDALSIVKLYRDVYHLESQAREGPAEGLLERRAVIRREQTTPIMHRIRSEAERIAQSYHAQHPLAAGARYIIKQFGALTAFLTNALLPPDNNAAEGKLRVNAMIRKSSLFFGTDEAGEHGATAMTILLSCSMADVEPMDYLMQVTPYLVMHDRGRKQDLNRLLPTEFAKNPFGAHSL